MADAFLAMYIFEATCQIQIAAQSGGAELIPVSQSIIDGVAESVRVQTGGMGGRFVWPTLLRRLERRDPSYRS